MASIILLPLRVESANVLRFGLAPDTMPGAPVPGTEANRPR